MNKEKRKFYRTVIQYEVLSEAPFSSRTLEQIAYETTEGACSGQFLETLQEEVDGPTMAELLEKQGSHPNFFNLDEDGNDLK